MSTWTAPWLLSGEGLAVNRRGVAIQRMHLGRFVGANGEVWQWMETTAEQKQILSALGIPEPP